MELAYGQLGNTIRRARIENKMTQEELAEKVGITPTHLKHLESEHRKPSIEVLFSLAAVLHFSLDSLLLPLNANAEKTALIQEIDLLLPECSNRELRAVLTALRELTQS